MVTWIIVDDEPDILETVLAMYEIWGIDGIGFVDGAEAIDWIEKVDSGQVEGELPQFLITDMRLPECTGGEVCERVRRSPILSNIPVVIMTAFRMSPVQEAALKTFCDFDALWYKPLPMMSELRRKIDEVIQEHRWRGSD